MAFRSRARSSMILGLSLAALLLAMAIPPATAAADYSISLDKIASGLQSPTQITSANDGTGRLFVVEQRGTVRVIQGGVLQPGYFLDIRSKVAQGGERGLLGLAFHPSFASNHRFYVYYTRPGGDVVVSRFLANSLATKGNTATASPLLLIEHSAASNHNGGAMAFGPNGYLYIGVGDGGGSGDPGNDAQQKSKNFLGKILRIDVNHGGYGRFDRYAVPHTNPFFGSSKPGLGEIWAYGLRNPWRISFDRETGRLYIADVGQGRYEEIDRQASANLGGSNYGWNAMEGLHCYSSSKCPLAGDTLPVAEYSHEGGNCAITGGYVYRGPTQTLMTGDYIFADWCSGRIWSIPAVGSTLTLRATRPNDHITSFGESEDGELYAVTSAGDVYQVLAS
jgi:glucose/arabinose dehydrogenase